MSRQIIIETPFPTLEETAHTLGVSVARAKAYRKDVGPAQNNKVSEGERKTKTSSEICREKSLEEGVSGIQSF